MTVRQVIQCQYLTAVVKKLFDHMAAYKAGTACNQGFHEALIGYLTYPGAVVRSL